jgi:hypothetical protein
MSDSTWVSVSCAGVYEKMLRCFHHRRKTHLIGEKHILEVRDESEKSEVLNELKVQG